MKDTYFKVRLLSDVVLNSKLATEGNMTTLDFIPGSNFLGVVARVLYKENTDENFEIFHSGKVRFGDATVSYNELLSYTLPGMYYTDKIKKDLSEDPIYLDYLIDRKNPTTDSKGKLIQLKQVRKGYFLTNYNLVDELNKTFSIKSAQDRKTRTSDEGKMFGFESLLKGQEFIFSVQFDEDKWIQPVENALIGIHRLGKSKNAEFGQIEIAKIETPTLTGSFDLADKVLIYAQSHLCFVDEYGMPTFQPTVQQLGLDSGSVDYTTSQIRTHIYSPWNFKRNTTNTQRNCIAKGSVFVINGATKKTDSNVVGLFQVEGLGRVLYNPAFLKGESNAISSVRFSKCDNGEPKSASKSKLETKLSTFLSKKMSDKKNELQVSEAVQKSVYSSDDKIKRLKNISSSQWGGIRAFAIKARNMEELEKQLFDKEIGYLTHGVAYEKHWGANRETHLNALKEIIKVHKKFDTQFIAKFAAEMAKESSKAKANKK